MHKLYKNEYWKDMWYYKKTTTEKILEKRYKN